MQHLVLLTGIILIREIHSNGLDDPPRLSDIHHISRLVLGTSGSNVILEVCFDPRVLSLNASQFEIAVVF